MRLTDLGDLRGVREREEAELAGSIPMERPTKAMRDEAATAGTHEYAGTSYPRLQLLTVHEVLEGKRRFRTPSKVGSRISTGQAVLQP